MLLTCEAIFGNERGGQLRKCIEDSTGEVCPCRQGKSCPLMPADVPTPRESLELAENPPFD